VVTLARRRIAVSVGARPVMLRLAAFRRGCVSIGRRCAAVGFGGRALTSSGEPVGLRRTAIDPSLGPFSRSGTTIVRRAPAVGRRFASGERRATVHLGEPKSTLLELLGGLVTMTGRVVAQTACAIALGPRQIALVADAVPCLAIPIALLENVVS